jgi:hypothetical protein
VEAALLAQVEEVVQVDSHRLLRRPRELKMTTMMERGGILGQGQGEAQGESEVSRHRRW